MMTALCLYVLISSVVTYFYIDASNSAIDHFSSSGSFSEKEIDYMKFVAVVNGVKAFLFWPIAFLFTGVNIGDV